MHGFIPEIYLFYLHLPAEIFVHFNIIITETGLYRKCFMKIGEIIKIVLIFPLMYDRISKHDYFSLFFQNIDATWRIFQWKH